MSAQLRNSYQFHRFELDTKNHALYFDGELIDGVGKKSLQVLAVLAENANKLVAHQHLIDDVWGEEAFGVRADHVNHYISKLRTTLSRYAPDRDFIRNEKGRGYVFTEKVECVSAGTEEQNLIDSSKVGNASKQDHTKRERGSSRSFSALYLGLGGLVVLMILVSGYWSWFRQDDQESIRQVVTESQLYESLVIYKDPVSFNEQDLDKYWFKDIETDSNYDRRRIRDAVKKLIMEGRKYGSETKCERFEIQSIELNEKKDFADVRTLEKWFIADYHSEGTLLRNRTIGPYFVSYILRKVDGRWLIEKSNTARSVRPIPYIADIEITTEIKAGRQFLARITGRDFEPESIYIDVVGPGCPDPKPCKIPNSVILEKSTVSSSEMTNIPFTLATGQFKIVARNGESSPSNPTYINVP